MNNKEEKLRTPRPAEAEMTPEIEIDYVGLLYSLLEKAKYIAGAALIGMLIMAVYSFVLASPVYEAVCKVYVVNNGDSAINLADLQMGSYLASDFLDVFDAWEVKEQVLQNLDLDYTYRELEEMLTVSNPSDTRILNVKVRDGDPALAARIANEYAEVASDYIAEVMVTDRPTVLSSALEPVEPVAPRKVYNMALGFLLGGVGMAAVFAVLYLTDNKFKSAEEVRKYTGMAVLAVVPSNDELDNPGVRKPRNTRKERR